jgi:hypothetical protein
MSTPGPNLYEGLFNLIGNVMGHNARQRQESNMYGDVAKFGQDLNNLDYGNQTTTQDLTPQNSAGMQQISQGLLPTNFNQQSPDASMLGQGLLGQVMQQPQQQAQQQPNNYNITNPMDQYSQANNPTQTTTSAPKSLMEQTNMIKSQIPSAMQALVKKGYKPNEVLPLLQQAAQDKIAEHTSNYNQQQTQALLQQFQGTNDPMQQAALAARLKQQFGYDVGTAYKDFKHDYSTVNTGDSQTAFDKNNGTFGNKTAINQSPDNIANNDTKIKTTGMNNATTLQAASMRGSGRGRGGSTKLDKASTWAQTYELGGYHRDQATIDQYNEAKDNDTITPALQRAAETAMGSMNQYWKISSGGEYNSQDPQQQQQQAQQQDQNDPVANAINQAKQGGASKEEILQQLSKRGITGYDSYVW